MTAKAREDSLDILKGIACLFMVIAHQPYYSKAPDVALGLINHFSGIFPPALFFSIAGVTATFQSTKYSLASLVRYFIAMCLIGMTWNIVIHGDVTAFFWPEIFQIIALGSLFVCIVERNGPSPQWLLLTITIGIISTKLIAETYWPQFDGWNFLFCDTNYVPEIDSIANTMPILPGFPLFPWLAYFFFGIWCYRASKRLKLLAAGASLGAAIGCVALGSNAIEKWDSSIAYLFTDGAVICAAFWLFEGYGAAGSALARQLRKIGSNAFLFFFAHPLGLIAGVLVYIAKPNAYMAWIVSIVVAVITYNLFTKFKPSRRFDSGFAWLVLIGATLLIPFLPMLNAHPSIPGITRLFALIIGIVAAVNFSGLAKVTKSRKITAGNASRIAVG